MTTASHPVLYEPTTERLQLRQWRTDDRAPFATMSADEQVMRSFPAPLNRSQSDAMADKCEALLAARGWGLWAVERKADRRFIGFVGLHVPQDPLPFMPCVEIGWRLARHAWHQGFASEAARAALQLGFEQLQLSEIVAFTTVSNLPSQALMQRLGMLRDRAGDFDHPALPGDHPLKAHVLYRISAASFAQNTGKTASV